MPKTGEGARRKHPKAGPGTAGSGSRPAPRPYWIAGAARTSDRFVIVNSPYDGGEAGRYWEPSDADVDAAVQAAADVADEAAALPAAVRSAALMQVSQSLTDRNEEIAHVITAESGKPLMWSRIELTRAASTFRWAAEEARRWSGETQRLDTDPAAVGRYAIIRRYPVGPVLGIAPFNFPMNLVAHKVAPSLAIGAPILIKPAPTTPLTALKLGELLSETDLPAGMWSVLPVDNDTSADLVIDPRLAVVSFTGSETVGYSIAHSIPLKHVTLELGGNAAAVVLADWDSDEDLEWAATRIATFANYQAGQSCISVQRVIIDESVATRLIPLITEKVKALPTGSPWDDETVVGPVINAAAAARIEDWIEEALEAGAHLAAGGSRKGCLVEPTVLTGVAPDARISTEEVFGPVMAVSVVSGVEEAFEAVNDSRYGLQAGIFTHNLQHAFSAQRRLHVGGVIIGDVPSFRADQMPYGGVKSSGIGREGVRAAMLDLSFERTLVLTGIEV
jgi:acyl-CoA reductase-like NAD-dependent aldehyde dehydrogenase